MNDIRALTQHEIDAVSGGPFPLLGLLVLGGLALGMGGCQVTVNTCDGGNCDQRGGDQDNDVDSGEDDDEGGDDT